MSVSHETKCQGWTSDPPSVEGWYWWSTAKPWAHRFGPTPIAVHVEIDLVGPSPCRWLVPGNETGDYEHNQDHSDSMWLGPIPTPEPPSR